MKKTNNIIFTSSPWGFRETDFCLQCQWLKHNNIDFICGQLFDSPGLFSPKLSKEKLLQKLDIANKYNLKFASFNVNGDFTVDQNIDKEIEICKNDIKKASLFSPQIIIVFAGWQERTDEAVFDQISDSLQEIADYASEFGIKVALENHGGLTTTPQQINRILDKVHSNNIGLNYDPANFLMYAQDPLKALNTIDHPIFFTHFKSLKLVNGAKEYCRINEGEIDYKPILDAISHRYSGFYGLEYEETTDVFEGSQDDLNTLKQLLNLKEI
ncbi:MAG: sugar phosphate isomerase/epimerase family protein [Sedimentisphaeraceae bacterium JB056]